MGPRDGAGASGVKQKNVTFLAANFSDFSLYFSLLSSSSSFSFL